MNVKPQHINPQTQHFETKAEVVGTKAVFFTGQETSHLQKSCEKLPETFLVPTPPEAGNTADNSLMSCAQRSALYSRWPLEVEVLPGMNAIRFTNLTRLLTDRLEWSW